MDHRPIALIALAALVAGCEPRASATDEVRLDTARAAAIAASGPSRGAVPDVAYGARVRIMSPRLGEGWHSGVVGRVGTCLAVMVPQQDGERVTGFSAIRFEHITRLRLSGRYDGRPSGPSGRPVEYRAGMDTIGEPWSELAIAPLQRRYGGCTPF